MMFRKAALLVAFASPSPLAVADDITSISPFVRADYFWDPDSLRNLSNEEREEALKPKYLMYDKQKGKVVKVLQHDTGNGRLDYGFVKNDPRNVFFHLPTSSPDKLGFGWLQPVPDSDISEADQELWYERSITSWFDKAQCIGESPFENVNLLLNADYPGLVEYYFSGGGIQLALIQTHVKHVGFRGLGPIVRPGATWLGVTYTLFWADSLGRLTDIDNDGRFDAAVTEIYYNARYPWTADETSQGYFPVDFPTVAIHEAGHGIGLDHMGMIAWKEDVDGNYELFSEPRAIMNAIYEGVMREPTGYDLRAVCSIWAEEEGDDRRQLRGGDIRDNLD